LGSVDGALYSTWFSLKIINNYTRRKIDDEENLAFGFCKSLMAVQWQPTSAGTPENGWVRVVEVRG